MTIQVQILFSGGSDGDDVDTYTPEVDVVGSGIIDSGANGMELDGAGACKWAASTDYFMIDTGIHEQRVITNYNAGGADNRMALYARALNATVDGSCDRYNCLVRPGFADEFTILKEGTSSATLATLSSFVWNLSTTYEIDFRVTTNGANVDLEVWVDGVLELSATDSSSPYTAGDFAGLTGFFRTDANGRWSDFQVEDLISTTLKTLANTALGTASLSRVVTYARTLASTALGTASLTRVSSFFRTLAASGIGTASLAKGLVSSFSAAATAIGTSTVASLSVVGVSTSYIATGTVSIVKKIGKILGFSGVGTETVIKKMILLPKASTAVGTASTTESVEGSESSSATGTGTSSLSTLFIAGTGAVLNFIRRIALRIGLGL